MFDLFLELWYFWLLVILAALFAWFKPQIKGFMGEKIVSLLLLCLDKEKYKVINDVIIKNGDITSQIDNVVVSKFGVFVIETKNYKGWIFGYEYKKILDSSII